MLTVMLLQQGVVLERWPQGVSITAACASWCSHNGAEVAVVVEGQYMATVTVELPDRSRRELEFVLVVG